MQPQQPGQPGQPVYVVRGAPATQSYVMQRPGVQYVQQPMATYAAQPAAATYVMQQGMQPAMQTSIPGAVPHAMAQPVQMFAAPQATMTSMGNVVYMKQPAQPMYVQAIGNRGGAIDPRAVSQTVPSVVYQRAQPASPSQIFMGRGPTMQTLSGNPIPQHLVPAKAASLRPGPHVGLPQTPDQAPRGALPTPPGQVAERGAEARRAPSPEVPSSPAATRKELKKQKAEEAKRVAEEGKREKERLAQEKKEKREQERTKKKEEKKKKKNGEDEEETIYFSNPSPGVGEEDEDTALSLLGDFVVPCGQIVLGKSLGRGQFGEAFEGEYLGTKVAVKELGMMTKKAATRFLTELGMLRTIRHPNVLLYMGISHENGRYALVTEHVEFGSLEDILHGKKGKKERELKELTPERIHLILEGTARGMNYLHNKEPRIIHRDLKSANLLLTENWQTKITDFGLALNLADSMKEGTSVVGAANYVAPEVIRGERYNEKVDVFSFGVILWEILEGKVPWDGLSGFQILNRVGMQRDRLGISKQLMQKLHLRPYISLMQKCWAENAQDRPTFASIIDILENMKADAQS